MQQGGPNASAYAWYLTGSTGQTPPQVLTYAFSVNENQDVTPTPIESVAPQTTPPLWPTGAAKPEPCIYEREQQHYN